MRPVIGITGNELLEAVERFGNNPITYTPQGFVQGVQQAEGMPIVIPISSPAAAPAYIRMVDALLLTGGYDVSPHYYGADYGLHMQATHPQRDAFELALLHEAITQQKPVLAVCRGLQLLNVYFGGTLYQDLQAEYSPLKIQHVQQTAFRFPVHSITIEPGSYLASLAGKSLEVNSFHHQAINRLGDGLSPTAYSPDGLVEAVEWMDQEHSLLGIQWHPEIMLTPHTTMRIFFDDLIARAKKGQS